MVTGHVGKPSKTKGYNTLVLDYGRKPDGGVYVEPSAITVIARLERWYWGREHFLELETRRCYRAEIDLHLVLRIGQMPISDVRPGGHRPSSAGNASCTAA